MEPHPGGGGYVPRLPVLPYTCSRPAPLHLVHPFKTSYIILLQTHCIKEPSGPRITDVSPSTLPCCWCFGWYVPEPGPFLATLWLRKPFLSEMLSDAKVFCLTVTKALLHFQKDLYYY